jgi:predicted ATPase
MLLVGAVRTEDAAGNRALTALVASLRHNNQLTELHLAPLSPQETAALAEQTAGASITAAKAQAFYRASEGHPLFLIETVRGGLAATVPLDAGRPRTTHPAQGDGLAPIPPKIYNLLSARLGQLSPAAHEVANRAAVIGRSFTYGVLQATMDKSELSLIDALDELWARRIIREQQDDTYDFSHDRIREVAYLEISRTRRRLLHRQVAAALEAIHSDDPDKVAGELAAHYAQAGDSEPACRYYRQAAKVALNLLVTS